jgi:hypothetical protein
LKPHFFEKGNGMFSALRLSINDNVTSLTVFTRHTMQRTLWAFLLLPVSLPALAADCVYYKDANRGGERFEQTAMAQSYELTNGFNDTISSVWVRDGFYALLTQDFKFQNTKIYLYGGGMSFTKAAWQFDKGMTADGGTWYNLVPFAFNDVATSVLCLKL